MKKTILFLAVAALISFVSIEGFKLSYNPPVIIKEVEKPVIIEKEVIREVIKEIPVVKYQVIETEVPVIEYKEKIVYVDKPKPIQPPVCPRCGKRHW